MGLNQFVADDFIAHAVDLERFTAGERKRVLKILKQLEKDLIFEVRAAGFDEVKATSFKQARLEKTLQQTQATIGTAYKRIKKEQKQAMRDLAELEDSVSRSIVNNRIGVDVLSVAVSPAQLRRIADDTLISAAPSATWWNRQDAQLKSKFSDTIRQGVLSGENNQQLVQRVRGTRAMGFNNGVMNAPRYQAEALVRSSVQAVSNTAREDSYLANMDVVKAVEQLSTLDTKTTNVCKAYDGKVWDISIGSDGNPVYTPVNHSLPFTSIDNQGVSHKGPPRHWSCRSTIIPVVKSWEELANQPIKTPAGGTAKNIGSLFNSQLKKKGFNKRQIDQAKANARASMDGAVADTTDYDKWLRLQVDTGNEQRAIEALGRTRYDMWREGLIKNTTDLVDQTGRELSVQELFEKYGVPKRQPKPKPPQPPIIEPQPTEPPRIVLPPDEPQSVAVWHNKSWTPEAVPEDIQSAVANSTPLKGGVTRRGGGTYYQPGGQFINISKATWDEHPATWRHEYAHHLDNVAGQRSRVGRFGFMHQGSNEYFNTHVKIDDKQLMKLTKQGSLNKWEYNKQEFNLLRAIDTFGTETQNKRIKYEFIDEWLREQGKLDAWKKGFNNIPKSQQKDPRRLAYLAQAFADTDVKELTKDFVRVRNSVQPTLPKPGSGWVTDVGTAADDPFFKGTGVEKIKEALAVKMGESGTPVTVDDLLTLLDIKTPTVANMRGVVNLGEAVANRDAREFLQVMRSNLITNELNEHRFYSQWNDYFGAITQNKIGGGHAKSYYASNVETFTDDSGKVSKFSTARTGESFAQWVSLRSWENGRGAVNDSLMQWFTPNTYRGYTELTNNYLVDWSG